jgi:glycosyltransferase involved in cell wall biosynthesis
VAKVPVSVLVQTKNEELSITKCLTGLVDFDEVIVIDSNSSDSTKTIAQSLGARIVNFDWDNRYPKKKQWQLENLQIRNDWILFLDADEELSPNLIREIKESVAQNDFVAFNIKLAYYFSGRRLRFGHTVVKRCLIRKTANFYPELDDLDIPGMGELEGHYQPMSLGKVGKLRERLIHNDIDPVDSWFARHNRYSTWEAQIGHRQNTVTAVRSLRSKQGQIFDRIPLKPIFFFIYSYGLRLGFLDGQAGLDYAIGLSFYYWQIRVKAREIVRLEGNG